MIRSRLLFSTNSLGADTSYAVGQRVVWGGVPWRITRHRVISTTPWVTIRVYGKPCRG
jgi:hypothetical protein